MQKTACVYSGDERFCGVAVNLWKLSVRRRKLNHPLCKMFKFMLSIEAKHFASQKSKGSMFPTEIK